MNTFLYFAVAATGIAFGLVVFLLTRRLAMDSWTSRFMIALLVGATVAPTYEPRFGIQAFPALGWLPALFSGDPEAAGYGLICGVIPALITVGLAGLLWVGCYTWHAPSRNSSSRMQ